MSPSESGARSAWRRRMTILASFAFLGAGCGRSVSRSDGTAGTTADMAGRGGASSGGGAGVGGTGIAGAGGTGDTGSGGDGGTGGSGGTTADAGRGAAGSGVGGAAAGAGGTGGTGGIGGEAGAEPANPPDCVGVPSTRGACSGGCTVNAAFALRCPSPLTDIEMAGPNLLIEHGTGADLFGFHHEGGLIPLESWDSLTRRELASDGDVPISVSENGEGGIVVSSSLPQNGGFYLGLGTLLDTGYDAQTLRVLAANEGTITLFSIGEDDSVMAEDVGADDASGASLVRGSSPPWVSLALDDGAWLYGPEEPRSISLPIPVFVGTSSYSAVALGERIVAGSFGQTPANGTSGSYIVNDDGVEQAFGTTRALGCPASYTANYPDLCEFELSPSVTTAGAVLAAELVAHEGKPWLASIVGDVTDSCRTMVGRCFESLPCDCQYTRSGSIAHATLRLEELDEPARLVQIELGDFPYETVQLAASSSETGALFVAVAEAQFTASGDHAGVHIDYFMVTP